MNKQEFSRSMARPDCWNTAFETELKSRLLNAERRLKALRAAAEQHLRDNPSGRGTLRLCAAIEASKRS